jgi:hypothetical protein
LMETLSIYFSHLIIPVWGHSSLKNYTSDAHQNIRHPTPSWASAFYPPNVSFFLDCDWHSRNWLGSANHHF